MKINYRQLSIMVFMSFIALKFLALPSLLYVESKNMSMLVALALMLIDGIYVFVLLDLMKKSGEKNIYEFMKSCLGTVITKLVLILLILKYALVAGNISKGLEFFVVENLYTEFNWFVFVLPLMILVGFMVYKGIRNIARVGEMVCWAIVIGLIYIALKALSGIDILSFLPFFKDGFKPLVDSAWIHLSWFGSATFMFMLFGFVDFRSEKKTEMIKYIITYVRENAPEEMEFFNKFIDTGLFERLDNVVNSDFGRITYTDAIKELEKVNDKFEFPVHWGTDIQTEHERYLSEVIFKRPVFVTDYPTEIKAFYMKQNPDGKTVAATDLLVPGIGEIIGGSQREDDFDKLSKRIDELGLDKKDYWWYLDLRRYGSCPHAGFGLGFERMMMYLTGIQNIRDVLPFPRTPKNCEF